jgi:general secretion pathway protein J
MKSIRSGSFYRNQKRRPLKPTSTKAGFSLVEVLAALLVTMLLVLTFTPFVSQMLATWSRGAEVANLVELKTRGLSRLREDLRHAIVLTGYGQVEELASFQGDESSMGFPVAALGSNEEGIEYLSFTVGVGVNGRALVRRRAPVIGSSYGSFVDPVILMTGPYRYVFRYFSRQGEEVTVWGKGRLDLPGRIELNVVDNNGRLLLGLPLAIPTFATMSAGCLAIASLQGCPILEQPSIDDALKAIGITTSNQGKS